jgi:hypothetical protein
MKNTLDYAKKYLLETNWEFFTQSEQNVIGKTMVSYADHINEDLLEQRNEMLAMLEELYEDVECWSDISSYGYGNKIEQLIKKVKGNGVQ